MNPWQTRVVYLGFIIAFCILGTGVILFGLGFTYNAKKKLIVQQGGIFLTFAPKDARVVMDGIVQKPMHPFVASNLVPGLHTLQLEKSGYHAWEKKINIEAGRSTNIHNVILFPKTIPVETHSPPSFPKVEPHGFIAVTPPTTGSRGAEPRTESHSPTGSPSWLSGAREEPPFSPFRFRLSSTPAALHIGLVGFTGTTTLPAMPNPRLFESPKYDVLTVSDANRRVVYVIFPAARGLRQETFSEVNHWEYNHQRLLVAQDFELWMFDFASREKILIARFASGFTLARLYRENYVLAVSENALLVTEINDVFGRSTIELARFPHIRNFFIVKDVVYLEANLTETDQTPRWFEYRIE